MLLPIENTDAVSSLGKHNGSYNLFFKTNKIKERKGKKNKIVPKTKNKQLKRGKNRVYQYGKMVSSE